jgi:hypothetical protein
VQTVVDELVFVHRAPVPGAVRLRKVVPHANNA